VAGQGLASHGGVGHGGARHGMVSRGINHVSKLSPTARSRLSAKTFALPGRRYPLNNPSHARNALARASQHATPAERATIKRKVKARFPSIDVS